MLPHAPARRPRLSRALLLATATLAACGGKEGVTDPPVPPAVTRYVSTTPVRGTLARAFYRDTLLDFERAVFYWDDRVDWTAHHAQLRARVNAAATHGQLWQAAAGSIEPWFRNVGDEHSQFFPPSESPGVVDAEPGNAAYLVSGTTLTAAASPPLAYLYLPTYTGIRDTGRADSTQAVIRALDANGPCGWVLDLRFNPGGTWAAMMAGINPIFGDAPAGRGAAGFAGLVDRENTRYGFYVQGGRAGVFDPLDGRRFVQVEATSNYTLKRPGSPVAVLTGPATASAGELITLGFRGGPVPVRSFGEPTYGVTTTPAGIYLEPDSGYLNITAGVMSDRTGRLYGGKVEPDQPVNGGPDYETLVYGLFGRSLSRATPTPDPADPVLNAATAWLRQQPACAVGAVAQRVPAEARATAPVRLPGVVRPGGIGADRIGRHFLRRDRPRVAAR